MSEISNRICRIRRNKKLSQHDVAVYLGVSDRTYQRFEKNPEDLERIRKIATFFDVSDDFLLTGVKKDSKSETKKDDSVSLSVSLLQAGAGEGVYNFETQKKLLSLSPDYFPFLTKEKIVAVEIVGESMEPTLRQGDYILITPSKEERQTEDGIYAIRVEGMVKVKSLQFLLDGTIKIISDNPKFHPEIFDPKNSQVDFSIIGKKRLLISR